MNTNTNTPGTTAISSTGGVIKFTKTGLVHTAGKGYGGKTAAQDAADTKDFNDTL